MERSVSILDKTADPEHVFKVRPLTEVGLGFRVQGDDAAGAAYFRRALHIVEATMGSDPITQSTGALGARSGITS